MAAAMMSQLAIKDDAAQQESGGAVSMHDLPNETLTMLFGSLCARDLAAAQCVCTSWRALGRNPVLWEAACRKRWRVWSPERWDVMMAAGQWQRMYSERNAIDARAAAAVGDMPFPNKRYGSFCALTKECGEDAIEALEAAAEDEAGTPGLGRRHWSELAAMHLTANAAAKELNSLKDSEAPDVPMDTGALVLARAFSPGRGQDEGDSSWVPGFLDDLAVELKRRVVAAGKSIEADRRASLQLLNQILFGPRAVEDAPSSLNEEGEEQFDSRPSVPSDGYGLGLTGNRNNYYDVRNSMLHQVLIRRTGIPITLAVVQCSVGVRCGMHLQAVGMPCHLLTKLGEPGDPEETFIDCFDSGRMMTRSEACDLMTSLGLPREERFLAALQTYEVHVRMCANLVHILRKQKDFRPLWQLLEMLRDFHQLPDYLLMHAQMMLMRLEMPLSAQKDIEDLMECYTQFPAERMSLMIGHLSRNINDILTKQREEAGTVNLPFPGLGCKVGDLVRFRGRTCPHADPGRAAGGSPNSYRGVVISWDPRCTASEEWMNHTNVSALKNGADQPFYRVLVDVRDRDGQATYVAQENIELLAPEAAAAAAMGRGSGGDPATAAAALAEDWQIQHPELGFHFEGFSWEGPDGGIWPHYIPNAYVSSRFPAVH